MLMANFDISHNEVMKSVWFVVETVNRVDEFHIQYPMDTDMQKKIAEDFSAVSGVGLGKKGRDRSKEMEENTSLA